MQTLLIKNAKVVNVFTKEILEGAVLCRGGIIEAVFAAGEALPDADRCYDAHSSYLLPGLIDAHTHIEMSQLSAAPFAEAVLRQGTTTAILDPHDIVNVMDAEGAALLMDELKTTRLKGIFMAPPCVPSSPPFEDSGCSIELTQVRRMIEDYGMYGIAETMDFGRVLDQEPELKKILDWAKEKKLMIDGHAPGVSGLDLQKYRNSGPLTDHESITAEEMRERLETGMYVILRRGSLKEPVKAPEFLSGLSDTSRVLLSTDGCINVRDMTEKGHMNYALRQIVAEDIDPMTAIQLATINTASAYGLKDRGAIAPGLAADFCLVKDLKDFETEDVFTDGCLLAPGTARTSSYTFPEHALHTIKHRLLTPEDFAITPPAGASKAEVRLLHLIEGTLDTKEGRATLDTAGGKLIIRPEQDITKAAVIHRYEPEGSIGLGLISGFGHINGAVACSIAQDTQNMIVTGSSEEDMTAAANQVISMNGGIAVWSEGKCIRSLPLPIAGIMTDLSAQALADEMDKITQSIKALGSTLADPVFAMSMQIPLAVIPEMALTNRGLLNVSAGEFVPLFITPDTSPVNP